MIKGRSRKDIVYPGFSSANVCQRLLYLLDWISPIVVHVKNASGRIK